MHPSLKTAWPNQPVIGNTANWWPSCDPSFHAVSAHQGSVGLGIPVSYHGTEWMPTLDGTNRFLYINTHLRIPYTVFVTAADLAFWASDFPARCYLKRSRQLQYPDLVGSSNPNPVSHLVVIDARETMAATP